MISTVINSLRLFKGLYNLAFSEGQLYAEQRDEFLGGVQHCIEQASRVIAILNLCGYVSGSRSRCW
jgi:hypothetical protein